MEIIEGGWRYEDIRSRAYWSKVHLNSHYKPDAADAIEYAKHLKDCEKFPTVGMLAMKNAQDGPKTEYYARNMYMLKQRPPVRAANNKFKAAYERLYPKTGAARKYLIEKEHIVLNYVKKCEWTLGKQFVKLFGKLFVNMVL